MTHIDPGSLGAKRATFRSANPRRTLREIIDRNPDFDEKGWREQFWDLIKDDLSDSGDLKACIEYWLDNNLRSLMPQLHRGSTSRTSTASEIEKETNRLLLQLVMPNGKRLAECTGSDCVRFGGWYSAIAALVPPDQIVGVHLDEQKLQQLWQSHAISQP